MAPPPPASDAQRRSVLLAPLSAGFVCVLVGFTSSYALIVAAAHAMDMSRDQLVTMTLALCIAMGLTTLLPSVMLRIPVVTAWSTPGAALLVTAVDGLPLQVAIGAFLACGLLLTLAGATGWFARSMQRIPLSIASALLAGVLLRFALEAFSGLGTALGIMAPMLAAWMLFKRVSPRYCIPVVLVTGVGAALWSGRLDLPALSVGVAWPVPLLPHFEFAALLGVTLPLFVVTMASQNVPGVAVLRASGYDAPVSGLVTLTGVVTVALAPFGVFAVNLAAITAAICMGEAAHPDPRRRWQASACAGVFYLLLTLAAGSLVDVFAAFPRELVIGIAGLALMPTIAAGLAQAMDHEAEREAALLTFVVTASGVTLAGIGSAFWAVVLGLGLRLINTRAGRR